MKQASWMGLLLTLACVVPTTAECPRDCLCRQGVVKCINRGLDEVPDELPEDAVEIDLQFNNIEELQTGTFARFTNLRKLSLGNNNIFHIEETAFEGLQSLTYLDLKRNELSSMDPLAFKGLASLKTLDLSNNLIETLDRGIFRDLVSLKRIFLDNNVLSCDCELSWMVGLVQQGVIRPPPLCNHPPERKGRNLLTLLSHGLCREPTISGPPTDEEVKVGGSAAFVCVVEGEPMPKVSWLKNNVPVVEDDERILVLDDGSLIIMDVTGDDIAAYKCVATNAVSRTISNSAQLRVIDLSQPSIPVITKKPEQRSVVENEGTTFQCGAVGHPKPSIDWTFNGRTVTTDPRFYIEPSGTLVMESLKAIDAGLYKCIAKNSLGEAFEYAPLQIFIAPVFSTKPQSQRVVAGHPVFFSCDASAEPPAKINWKKDGQDLTSTEHININPSGTTLAINSATRFDEGTYECIADNLGGVASIFATLTVVSTASPRFSRVSQNVTTYVGNNIRLQCEVDGGDPPPVVKWMRSSEPLPITTNSKYEVGHDGVLVIRDLEYRDEGTYMCMAENVAGIVREHVTVSIRDPRFSPIDNSVISDSVDTVSRTVDTAVSRTRADLDRVRHRPVSGHELMKNGKYPPTRALSLSRAAEVFEQTIEKLFREMHSGVHYNISFDEDMKYEELLTPNQLILLSSLSGCTEHRRVVDTCDDLCFHQRYRTFDGICNNLQSPMHGASLTALYRVLPPRYENNFNLPIGWSRNKLYHGHATPSARKVSLQLLSTSQTSSDEDLSQMVMQWGQFLDHDLGFSPQAVSNARFSDGRFCNDTCNSQSPCFPIPVTPDDPRVTNHRCIGFVRSSPMCGSGMTSTLFRHKAIHRQQVNIVTSFIDASNVYGSSEEDASSLRNHNTDQGLLRTGVPSNYNRNKRLLPPNQGEFIDCQIDPNTAHVPCFQAGDHRVNEQLGLVSMHTLWFREHNRLAGLLKRMNSHWDGDTTYHETRKIIGAMMQHITYKHWLPLVLGPSGMDKIGEYTGYDPSVDPSISNEFSTAAFRFGHSLIKPILSRLNSSFQPIEEGHLMLHKVFFAPFRLVEEGGIDPILRGLFAIPAKKVEPGEFITQELTERLFEMAHEVSLDLAAFNIQRGRDHGLATYNSYRKLCGLREATTFDDLSREISSSMVRDKLKHLYGHPDNIDLFAGGLVEDALPGARMGETFQCIIADQFKRLRDGDRFWYEKTGMFSDDQMAEIKKSTLSRVICDNSDNIMEVQKDVFKLVKNESELLDCYSPDIPVIDVRPWSQCCQSCSRSGDFSSSRTQRSVDPMDELRQRGFMETKWEDDANMLGNDYKQEMETRMNSFEMTVESLNQIIAELKSTIKSMEGDKKN